MAPYCSSLQSVDAPVHSTDAQTLSSRNRRPWSTLMPSPASASANTAMFCVSEANGTPIARPLSVPSLPKITRSEGRLGAIVMAPFGAATPARVSSQPANSVSASGTARAKRLATPSVAKPSARLPPAPPSRSGTQQSGRPASESARQDGVFHAPSSSRLMACGSARSAKIRAAISATIWSLSPIIRFRGVLQPFARAIVMPSSHDGKLSRLRPGLLVDRRKHAR